MNLPKPPSMIKPPKQDKPHKVVVPNTLASKQRVLDNRVAGLKFPPVAKPVTVGSMVAQVKEVAKVVEGRDALDRARKVAPIALMPVMPVMPVMLPPKVVIPRVVPIKVMEGVVPQVAKIERKFAPLARTLTPKMPVVPVGLPIEVRAVPPCTTSTNVPNAKVGEASSVAPLEAQPPTGVPIMSRAVTGVIEVGNGVISGSLPKALDGLSKLPNSKQREAVELSKSDISFVLTGAAGSGKTFTVHNILEELFNSGKLTYIDNFRDTMGNSSADCQAYDVAIAAYTNRAVTNMESTLKARKPELWEELAPNFITLHKLLRVRPVSTVNKDGQPSKIMTPMHDSEFKIPIKYLIVEEASMVSLDLWKWVYEALPEGCIIIFLGDIYQLPPIYGQSILMAALKALPIVELTHIYRQAEGSGIIELAHAIKDGEYHKVESIIDRADDIEWVGRENQVTHPARWTRGLVNVVAALSAEGKYDMMVDTMLVAFNKHDAGRLAINASLAQYRDNIRRQQGEEVLIWEVRSGFETTYLAVGDRVYSDTHKCEGVITSFVRNPQYGGKLPQHPSLTMDRHGIDVFADSEADELLGLTDIVLCTPDNISINTGVGDGEDMFRQASHCVEVELETGATVTLSTSGEVNGLWICYCMTTHKAQGCQWGRVLVVAHKSHGISLNREWLYTACTRPQHKLMLVIARDVLQHGIAKQKCKGLTLQAKIDYYTSKLTHSVPLLK